MGMRQDVGWTTGLGDTERQFMSIYLHRCSFLFWHLPGVHFTNRLPNFINKTLRFLESKTFYNVTEFLADHLGHRPFWKLALFWQWSKLANEQDVWLQMLYVWSGHCGQNVSLYLTFVFCVQCQWHYELWVWVGSDFSLRPTAFWVRGDWWVFYCQQRFSVFWFILFKKASSDTPLNTSF